MRRLNFNNTDNRFRNSVSFPSILYLLGVNRFYLLSKDFGSNYIGPVGFFKCNCLYRRLFVG